MLPAEIANLHGIRGQVTLLPARSLPAEPRAVVCGDGYLVPPAGGIACCGASFLRGVAIGPATQAEQQENLHRVAALLREKAELAAEAASPQPAATGRPGARCRGIYRTFRGIG